MKRREALSLSMYATGVLLAPSYPVKVISEIINAVTSQKNTVQRVAFSAEQFEQVRILCDLFLPRTESPAASEVAVPEAIDQLIGVVYTASDRTNYLKNLDDLIAHLKFESFHTKSNKEQEKWLLTILERPNSERNGVFWALTMMYFQSIDFYLSSEEIGEQYLNYLPVPGSYNPCISVEEVNHKLWSI